jgi:hypothetical protein
MTRRVTVPSALALALTAATGAQAEEHIFTYDAASDAARSLAETGLSFQFEGRLMGGYKLERIIQTGEQGSAVLRYSSDRDLGPGGLRAVLGKAPPVGGLYEIKPDAADGRAFINAICPGAQRGWLVVGPLKRFHDLPVQVIGKDEGASSARHCTDLKFSFKSEIALPPDRTPPEQIEQVGHAP